MKKFDRFLLGAAVAVLIMAFVFLPSDRVPFGKTNLVFAQWWNDDMDAAFLADIIKEYEDNNSGITITLANMPYNRLKNEYPAYVQAIIANNKNTKKSLPDDMPDIVALDPLWFDEYEKIILFEDIADEKYSAKIYSYFNSLFYNIDILESIGLDRPPKNREELRNAFRLLKQEDIYGLSVGDNFFTDIFPWLCSETDGASLKYLYDEKDRFDFMDKSVIASLSFLNDLNVENLIDRPPYIKNEEEKINNFFSGKTAMIVVSSKLLKTIEKSGTAVRYGFTNIPAGNDNFRRPVLNMTDVHVAMLATSEHKEEAASFIMFLVEKSREISAAAGAIPSDIFDFGTESRKKLDAKAEDLLLNAECIDDWMLWTDSASLNTIANEEIGLMFKRSRDAEETAAAIKSRYASAQNSY
jgi:ABC-type glycerol-3-phosphate transport system substrate-binding protein